MKFFFVFVLALLPLLSSAQEGEMGAGTDPNHSDEKAIEDLESAQQKRMEKVQAISKLANPALSTEAPKFDTSTVMDIERLNAVEEMVKQAKMSQVPEDVMREKVLEMFKGNAFEKYVRTSPKLVSFIVDFLRDEKAPINIIHILKDRNRLKTYLYFWIAIMFIAYYLKRVFVSKYWPRTARIIASVCFSLVITVICTSTFCIIFSEEMKPIIALVKKHL